MGTNNKKPRATTLKEWIDNNIVFIIFPFIAIVFLLTLKFETMHWLMLLPVGLLLAYDINFRLKNKGRWRHYGRDYQATLHGIRAAIQYTTFLFGFVGIALGQFLSFESDNLLFVYFKSSDWIRVYGIAVVLMVIILLLFLPITYRYPDNNDEPTIALKNYYSLVLFLQKVVILLTMYLILNFGVVNYKHFHNKSIPHAKIEECVS